MKKKETLQTAISIPFEVENKIVDIQFSSVSLRNWINGLKIKPGQQSVSFKFNFNGKPYVKKINISEELATIKRAVKLSELVFDIIPQYLSIYLNDVTQELAQKQGFRAVGREHEINKAWFYLSQETRNNVFLIGEKDVGKTTIAMEIARRIATNDCPREFYNKRVIMFSPEELLKINVGFLYDHKVNQIIDFLACNKDEIILFVDKALLLKSDVGLVKILISCIKKYNVPLMVTSSEENFDNYFFEDQSIAKYVNFIQVEEPMLNKIAPMLKPHIMKLQKQYGISISERAIQYIIFTCNLNQTVSSNPGKVINILERSFLNAKMNDKKEVDKESVLSCYDIRIKDFINQQEEEKRATAYHEAGHYLLTIKSKHLTDVNIACVSTLPMNQWVGVTYSYHDPSEFSIYSREYYLDLIAMFLAGRIAERKYTKLDSAGASSDLQKANNIARAMITQWGFSEKVENSNRQYNSTEWNLLPESKKEAIDREITSLLMIGYNRASLVIETHEKLLTAIVEQLMKDEILTGDELKAIVDNFEKGLNS